MAVTEVQMKKIAKCDRCHKLLVTEDSMFSCGYYDVSKGSSWSQFAVPGEEIICDTCMWNNKKYKQLYGKTPTPSPYRN